jgi:imidazolonepropionase-like amidohydrolase
MGDRGVIAVGAAADFLEWDGDKVLNNKTLSA